MLNNFLDNIFPKEILSGVERTQFIHLLSKYLFETRCTYSYKISEKLLYN